MTKKEERNRRLRFGYLALGLTVLSYTIAKITGDESGDWFKFSMLCLGLVGFIGGYLTLTDIFMRKV